MRIRHKAHDKSRKYTPKSRASLFSDEAQPSLPARKRDMFLRIGQSKIELVRDDITVQEVDAIVNAANSALAGGGGVDGAIHRAAGPLLMQQTRDRYPQGCPTGDAVATDAGKLKARHVFHAVGPVWRGGSANEKALLASAYRRCLELAVEHSCSSIAFPAISTGVYGYPKDLAAEVSLSTVRAHLLQQAMPALVRFVLFDAGSFGAYARVLEELAS
jgi:O-acetyl-ADP-ribose deacetylase (regulator of RNase III)